jgi:hypothetical protein
MLHLFLLATMTALLLVIYMKKTCLEFVRSNALNADIPLPDVVLCFPRETAVRSNPGTRYVTSRRIV